MTTDQIRAIRADALGRIEWLATTIIPPGSEEDAAEMALYSLATIKLCDKALRGRR